MRTATDYRGWQTSVAGDGGQRPFFLAGEWAERPCAENKTAAKPYRCAACHKTYATPRSLHQHRMRHAAAAAAAAAAVTDRPPCCDACGGPSADAHRPGGGLGHADWRPFGCARCEWTYRGGKGHHQTATVRRNADAAFACSECARTYRYERTLKRHALFAHGKGRRRFECDACDKTFASNSALRRHLETARCAGKPCKWCTNASCKDDRKSVILRRVFAYVLSRAVAAAAR